jgi:hypothetical protein
MATSSTDVDTVNQPGEQQVGLAVNGGRTLAARLRSDFGGARHELAETSVAVHADATPRTFGSDNLRNVDDSVAARLRRVVGFAWQDGGQRRARHNAWLAMLDDRARAAVREQVAAALSVPSDPRGNARDDVAL